MLLMPLMPLMHLLPLLLCHRITLHFVSGYLELGVQDLYDAGKQYSFVSSHIKTV